MPIEVTPDQTTAASMATCCPEAAGNVVVLSEHAAFNMDDGYYAHATPDHFWIQWRFHVLQQLIGKQDLGERILEVGCGNGVVQHQFETHYRRNVIGCDLNLAAMQTGLPTSGSRYLYNVLDERPQWHAAFDTVLLLDTLEHIDDPVGFLTSVRRHLAPGGRLVVNVPATPWLYSRYDAVQGHLKRYRIGRLATELQQAGFELQAARYWGANLVPIALLRKAMVAFLDSSRVMDQGFAPPCRAAEWLLRRLMQLEQSGIRLPGIGTSLAAIATAVDTKRGQTV